MKPLTLEEVVEATRGRLMSPVPSLSIRGVSTDSRTVEPGQLFLALVGQRYDGHEFVAEVLGKGAAAVVVSRVDHLADELRSQAVLIVVADTTVALGRLARYHRRQLAAQVIAVTGSNGKTTAKNMIHAVLSTSKQGRCSPESYNNQIGVPLTLLSGQGSDEYLVVEIGSNAPGEVHQLAELAGPDVAVITSVSATHLEGLKDIAGVAAEKASILRGLSAGGLAVVNVDHPMLMRHVLQGRPWRMVGFGLSEQADLRATDVKVAPDGTSFLVNGRFEISLGLLGRCNVLNALAAVAVGRRFGISYEQIAEALGQVAALPMRLERCRIGSVTVINDAYNANPDSCAEALEVLGRAQARGRRVAVMGDMKELGQQSGQLHAELGRRVAQAQVKLLVAVGSHAEEVAAAAKETAGNRLSVRRFADTAAAVSAMVGLLEPGDVVLLKGSRAMEMDRLLEPIRRKFGGR